MDNLGAKLREAREAEGVKLSAVAKRGDFSVGHMSNVEAGRRKVTDQVVLAYARALGEDCMRRRGLITGALGAGIIGPAAAGELIREGFTSALKRHDADEKWRGASRRIWPRLHGDRREPTVAAPRGRPDHAATAA